MVGQEFSAHRRGLRQVTAEKMARLRHLADALEWARGTSDEPWDYATDANPASLYAEWVRATDPEVLIPIFDELEDIRR